jgi:putative aminopeptidase FrvX
MKKLSIYAVIIFMLGSMMSCLARQPESKAWSLLKEMLLIPGVSGQESRVADFVLSSIPGSLNPNRDEMGNVWFTAGEGEPHIVFVAHTDEIGLIVEQITPKGTLKVQGKGGFFPKMYEGHLVVVYTKKGPVDGVVAPRKGSFSRTLDVSSFGIKDIEIYLGVSTKGEAENLGVSLGDQITIKKTITELSSELLCARGVDDRAGCAVLLDAVGKVDWDKIRGKRVTFVWDVQEEIGLYGASRMAEVLDADYVFPVDTFVSSDAPFDSKRFARLPLGQGAVIRAIDSSSITPWTYVQKVKNIAESNHIPVQTGNTRGGNDGSVFVPKGSVNIPLSWPGVYSHSFIEKIHKKDLEALSDLVVALAENWE